MKTGSLKQTRLAAALSSALLATGHWAAAQHQAELTIHTYAGLTITGEVGKVYCVEYVTQLNQQEDWKCLEFVELLESPYLWTDRSAPVREKRFYRAVQMDPPTNMVWIPPGTFRMGSPTNELGHYEYDVPQTEVTISRGFWMGKCEVTQGEFEELMGRNPSHYNTGDPRLPVDCTRPDAEAYCLATTQRESDSGRIPANCAFRLPTEAEWEYACRAGTSTRFSYGDDPDDSDLAQFAWYSGNSQGMTHPVGLKLPNPWGLFDMHGNAQEWCEFSFQYHLPGARVVDPLYAGFRFLNVEYTGGIMRGGGHFSDPVNCRSAFRPTFGDMDTSLGFRVVLAPVLVARNPFPEGDQEDSHPTPQ
jgi:formylglycine-generating enzyme required for sulfatase activity